MADVARFEAFARQVRFVAHAVSDAQQLLPDVPNVLTPHDMDVIRNDCIVKDDPLRGRHDVFVFPNMNAGTRVNDRRPLIIKGARTLAALLQHDNTAERAPFVRVIEPNLGNDTLPYIMCDAEAYVLCALEVEAHYVASLLYHGVMDGLIQLDWTQVSNDSVTPNKVYVAEETVFLRSMLFYSHAPHGVPRPLFSERVSRDTFTWGNQHYTDIRKAMYNRFNEITICYHLEKVRLRQWAICFCSQASWTFPYTFLEMQVNDALLFNNIMELCAYLRRRTWKTLDQAWLSMLLSYYRGYNVVGYFHCTSYDFKIPSQDVWSFEAPFGPEQHLCVQGRAHFDTITKPLIEEELATLREAPSVDIGHLIGYQSTSVVRNLTLLCHFGVGIDTLITLVVDDTRYEREWWSLVWVAIVTGYQYYNAQTYHGCDTGLRTALQYAERAMFCVNDSMTRNVSSRRHLEKVMAAMKTWHRKLPHIFRSLEDQCSFAPHLAMACVTMAMGRVPDEVERGVYVQRSKTCLQNAARLHRDQTCFVGFFDIAYAREWTYPYFVHDHWVGLAENITQTEACILYPYISRRHLDAIVAHIEAQHPLHYKQIVHLARVSHSQDLIFLHTKLDASLFRGIASAMDNVLVRDIAVHMFEEVDKYADHNLSTKNAATKTMLVSFAQAFAHHDVLKHVLYHDRVNMAQRMLLLPKICTPTLFRGAVHKHLPAKLIAFAEMLFGPESDAQRKRPRTRQQAREEEHRRTFV